ncbi:MAG: fatty acid desaturase [Myxococcota bacterium]
MHSKAESVARVRAISRMIREEEQHLRQRQPWLVHHDAIATIIFAVSLLVIGGLSAAFLIGGLPWWAAAVLIALPLSLLHELEHDLIHNLYFREQRWLQDAMFGVIFVAKMSLDPWSRRRIHLLHHRVSGQRDDIEERLIGLGMPMGFWRLLLTIIPASSVVIIPGVVRGLHRAHTRQPTPRPRWQSLAAGLSQVFVGAPLVILPAAIFGNPLAITLATLWVLPNIIRHTSIALISSSSHYYGDIPENAIDFQNQILDHWVTWPLQLFCFNFGATHVIHHYVVHQPFYIRQMVAPRVRQRMLDAGIRRNDLGTVHRANRYQQA